MEIKKPKQFRLRGGSVAVLNTVIYMSNVALLHTSGNTYLDKLAQLSPTPLDNQRKTLKKRAKAKFFTTSYLHHLIELDSPLRKSYVNTIFCCQTLHQVEDKITARYCNNRWCIVCNRIRIGKAINGYLPQLKGMTEPMFVTLTQGETVKRDDLRATIAGMVKTWRLIYQTLKKRRIDVTGIRKTECTYRPLTDLYHPHFHMIVDGKELAELIREEWLCRYPGANRGAQNIRPADEGSMLELFKYFTKVISKDKENAIYIPALDVIFQAMAGMRVFQSFGIRRVSEEVDELISETFDDLVKKETFWEWFNHDWIDSDTYEPLTGFKPSNEMIKLLDNIIS